MFNKFKYMKKIFTILLILFMICGCYTSKESFDGKDRPSNRGQLQVIGKQLCGEDGNPIVLRGSSIYELPYADRYINQDTISEISTFVGANVVRFAMYTYDTEGYTYCTGGEN